MAPTIPAALTYSKEHLGLSNKLRKPMVEKLRRDRINSSIEQLKSLLGPAFLQQEPDSKLEKADILEMAVYFLKQQQQKPVSKSSCSSPVSQGYSRCVHEINNFLSREEVMSLSQKRLLNHFHNPPSPLDKSVLPLLNSQTNDQQRGDSSQRRPLEAMVESCRLSTDTQTNRIEEACLRWARTVILSV